MALILRFVLRNIREKKLRTFLILLSVLLSAALWFASNGLATTLEGMFVQRMRIFYGSSDLIVHADQRSPGPFFRPSLPEALEGRVEYAVPIFQAGAEAVNRKPDGQRETVQLELTGIELADLARANPVRLASPLDPSSFHGQRLILARETAERFGLRPGDPLDLEIRGARRRFLLAAVALPSGPFQDVGVRTPAVVPREALAALFGARGLASAMVVRLRDPAYLQEVKAGLAAAHRRYLVRETLSVAEVREFSSRITTPFRLMTAFVLLMGVFIVYSSFKVIAAERLPVIGTFRSVGATRLATSLVLLAEGLAYGLLGGLAGCAAGIGVLHVMARLTAPGWMRGVPVSVSFDPGQLLQSFLLAVVLCLAGALLPVLRLARMPIRAVILGEDAGTRARSAARVPAGLAILAAAVTLPPLMPRSVALPVNTALLLSVLAAAVLLVPAVTAAAGRLLRRAWPVLLGSEGQLAAQNLRRDPGALNNITLLAIGISSLLLINTLGGSVEQEVAGFYRKARFQIWMWAWRADRRMESRLRAVPGVSDTLGVYGANDIEVASHGERIARLQGMGPQTAEWWDLRWRATRRRCAAGWSRGGGCWSPRCCGRSWACAGGTRSPCRPPGAPGTTGWPASSAP